MGMDRDEGDDRELATGRRRVLKCMLWAGSGVIWTVSGGVPRSRLLGAPDAAAAETGTFSFAQISDSHIGFRHEPNMDVTGTLRDAVARVRATRPSLVIHTGDVSHLSRADQFDTAAEVIRGSGAETHYVPGEHDVLEEGGRDFFARFM